MISKVVILSLALTTLVFCQTTAPATPPPMPKFNSQLLTAFSSWVQDNIGDNEDLLIYYENGGEGTDTEIEGAKQNIYDDEDSNQLLGLINNQSLLSNLINNNPPLTWAQWQAMNPVNKTTSYLKAAASSYDAQYYQADTNWYAIKYYGHQDIGAINASMSQFLNDPENAQYTKWAGEFYQDLHDLESLLIFDEDTQWEDWTPQQSDWIKGIEDQALADLETLHATMTNYSTNYANIQAQMKNESQVVKQLLNWQKTKPLSLTEQAALDGAYTDLKTLNDQLYQYGNGQYGALYDEATTVENFYVCQEAKCSVSEEESEGEEESVM